MKTGSGDQIELFVFPLPQVSIFPGTTKPLNIFEPRYVEMIDDAVKHERLVALAYTEPAGERSQAQGLLSHVRSIAGYGKVEIFERRPDGTMLILLDGLGKVFLEEVVVSPKPYIIARGRKIPEEAKLDSSHVFLLNRLMKKFRARLEEHIPEKSERDNIWQKLKTSEDKLNGYCAMMIDDPEQRQRLLEAEGHAERLNLATLLLESESGSSH